MNTSILRSQESAAIYGRLGMADDGSGRNATDSHVSGASVESGEESHERPELPRGRVVPLNSRRLTAAHLKRVAEALELPTTGSADQLRQLIEGKLESDKRVEATNVQVVIQEEQCVELKLSLMDESGILLTTEPIRFSKQEAESDMEAVQEALADANKQNSELSDQLANAVQKWEEEKAETARLSEELARVLAESSSATEGENKKLKEELRAAKERYKRMWCMTCEQGREQEELLAAQQEEIDRLKRHASVPSRASSPIGSLSLPPPSHSDHRSTMSTSPHEKVSPTGHTPPMKRRGKAPPIDSFTGEDPEVRIDDWLPALKRAASWNGWSEAETLIQLAGHLRGRALQEWNLLGESEHSTLDSAVKALRSRLESQSKAMAAQEFRHCAQTAGEGVADFIRRLEKTFRVAYGREAITPETRNALLYGQLHEGLLYRLMEAPACPGPLTTPLCVWQLEARSDGRRS